MPRLTEEVLLSFLYELKKTAAVNPRLGASATLGVLGALGGAGAGYLKNRMSDDPKSSTHAALQGAALGALGGAGTGAALPAAARGALSRFGMRELHGLTGFLPKGETLRSIRGGAYDAERNAVQASRALHAARLSGGDVAKAQDALGRAQRSASAARRAEDWGLTSIPGVAKAIRDKGLLPTVTRGAQAQFSGSSAVNKALMVGLPALGVVQAARAPEEEGMSRGQALGHQGGQLLGGLIGGALPFGAGFAVQEAAGRAGKTLGRAVDLARGHLGKPKKLDFRSYGPNPPMSSDLTQAQGQVVPSEVITTARANGTPPEGLA